MDRTGDTRKVELVYYYLVVLDVCTAAREGIFFYITLRGHVRNGQELLLLPTLYSCKTIASILYIHWIIFFELGIIPHISCEMHLGQKKGSFFGCCLFVGLISGLGIDINTFYVVVNFTKERLNKNKKVDVCSNFFLDSHHITINQKRKGKNCYTLCLVIIPRILAV